MKSRIPGAGKGASNMKLAQAKKLQEDMAALQAELDQREYTAESGGGMVEATVNGKHELVSIKIKPEAVDPEDIEMLEDLIMVAVNEANRKAAETAEKEMGAITQNLNLPGIF